MTRSKTLASAFFVALTSAACTNNTSGDGGGGSHKDGSIAESKIDGGVLHWPVQFGKPHTDESGKGVATDANGNVYVTGSAGSAHDDSGAAENSFLAKYEPSGQKAWLVEIPDVSSRSIAVDSAHSAIYVAGGVAIGGRSATVLFRFDMSGSKVWEQTLTTTPVQDKPSSGAGVRAVAVDATGDIYIAGSCNAPIMGVSPVATGNDDLLIAKYDSAGTVKWLKLLGSAESATLSGLSDVAYGVAVDGQGDAYIAGEVYGSVGGATNAGKQDIVTAKFDTNGNSLWVREIGTATEDSAQGVAVDATGNAYVAGFTTGGLDGNTNATNGQDDHDIVLVKYDTNGTKQWTRQLGGTASDVANGVALDPMGLPILGGTTDGDLDGHKNVYSTGTLGDMFALKYDASGKKLFSTEYGSDQDEDASSVAVDPHGNIFLTGMTDGKLGHNVNTGAGDAFIVRFGPTGNM
jgi:hypothetical protein